MLRRPVGKRREVVYQHGVCVALTGLTLALLYLDLVLLANNWSQNQLYTAVHQAYV